MARQFDPCKVLRQISNPYLREFFRRRGELEGVAWDELTEIGIQPIYDAWQALPPAKRREVQVILQDVNELADERGLAALAQEIAWRCPDQMEAYAAVGGGADKAMWAYLHVSDAFHEAAMFAQADRWATGRYWVKRNGLPRKALEVSDATKQDLVRELSAFYPLAQGRGHWCHVEHYRRANGAEYFFAYLDDYPHDHITWDDAGELQKRIERGAFDNVFVFTPADGTLELFARGGRKVHDPLQIAFCKAVLGIDVDPDEMAKPAYELDHLKFRDTPLPTEPADGVAEVRIRRLRLELINTPNRRISLEADPRAHLTDIYEMIERYLNQQNLPLASVRVTQATFQLTFMKDTVGKAKTLTFDVSYPNSSDLKSKSDEMRAVGERCLKMWGVTHE